MHKKTSVDLYIVTQEKVPQHYYAFRGRCCVMHDNHTSINRQPREPYAADCLVWWPLIQHWLRKRAWKATEHLLVMCPDHVLTAKATVHLQSAKAIRDARPPLEI
eukprot:6183660-Pleurochrysis_carterae.AAC.3